jgi:hypothetical protein
MFNLKQVYAILNFEKSKIKLLVVEKKVNKINCLYYDEISHTYLNDDIQFINANDLRERLLKMTKLADNFMGVNIKRYIVNISCLPLQIKSKTSPKFLTFGQILN